MKYIPRYYQEDAIKATFKYINKGGKAGLCCLPTGLGKSLVIAEIVRRILQGKPHVRAMMLTHVKELIEQNHEKLTSVWPTVPAGIFSAGIGFKQFSHPVIYAGIQSAYRNPALFGYIDIVLIDEAQLLSDKTDSMYGAMLDGLRKTNPNLVVIGLTATPYRMGMGLLTNGPVFDDIYYDVTKADDFVRFIDEGYLSDLRSVSTDTQIDLTGIKMSGGEFQEKSLDENVNRDYITKEIVLETIRRTQGMSKGLAFCVSKSHAENMALRFTEAGYNSTFIHSDLTKAEREKILEDYENGVYKVLTNVGVLTTGFDAPDIDFIVLARPTQSTGLHVQMVGRGLRPHPSKTFTLILDFASNTVRLGPINDPVIPMPKGQKGGEAPVRICEHCNTINYAGRKTCVECGEEFPPPEIKFSSTIAKAEIIKRADIPKIETFNVSGVSVNRHVSLKGNNTCKLTFATDNGLYDMHLMFDKRQRSSYMNAIRRLERLRFLEELPDLNSTHEAIEFLQNFLVKPDKVKIWLNKPTAGDSKKRHKEILDFIYN